MNDNQNKQFEEMLEIVFNDLKNIDKDEEFARMKKIYSAKNYTFNPLAKWNSELAKRAATYPKIYENFKDGKWDHKVKAKKVADQFYHKTEKNAAKKPAAVFGTTIPGDDKNIYDHDIWGNISYGYMLKKMGLTDFENEKAAAVDDLLQSLGSDKIDSDDSKMTKLGIKLFDQYEGQGKEMMLDNLREFIISNKIDLRKYDKSELEDRRYRTKGGEDAETIANKYGLTAEQLIEYNEKHEQGVKGLSKEQSFLPEVKPILPNYEEKIAMQQTPLPKENAKETAFEDNQNSQNKILTQPTGYDKIMNAIKENDNPHEDILYKHPSQIPENELKENMVYAGYETNDPELKQRLQDKTKSWFEHYYSTEPIKRDASGRQIEPEAKQPFPAESVEVLSKDNIPMSEAFKQVAERVAPLGVKALQKGLNTLYSEEYKKPKLKEDNVLGSKTASRMKEALASHGVETVKNNVGLGGFSSFLEDNRKKPVDNSLLKSTITSVKPKDGGSFLQRGLNGLGAFLKEDNDIGPKTTSAFNQIKDEQEDNLVSYFKKNLV